MAREWQLWRAIPFPCVAGQWHVAFRVEHRVQQLPDVCRLYAGLEQERVLLLRGRPPTSEQAAPMTNALERLDRGDDQSLGG